MSVLLQAMHDSNTNTVYENMKVEKELRIEAEVGHACFLPPCMAHAHLIRKRVGRQHDFLRKAFAHLGGGTDGALTLLVCSASLKQSEKA